MPSVLITGANRGIGLELARQYAEDDWHVHATARALESATDLKAVAGTVSHYALDVKDRAAIRQLAENITTPMDLVIANAGISGRSESGGMPGTVGALDYESWREVMEVNLFGAVATCEAFLPHVEKTKGTIVAISSQLASNANAFLGSYSYNSSKAALNMAMNLMAIELKPKDIAVGTLHPGWVQTDMGGKQAPVSPADSAKGLKQVIAGLKPSERAHFVDFMGSTHPW
ncbi:SDR family oxidoreductase [Parvularcula sp. IMCC14364]|uniref:SDR family oxidoreductase n=1 Tax=Parvularcula sp. IMCC14364 TaxID=3067902 RepID=UPI0027428A54|nr:SDR family oxidoreductase [Parvularcula sp. IMCC14364]